MEQKYNVREAPATKFDTFLFPYVDVNEQNVDRSVWPIHHRWRAINKALAAELLALTEVDEGYELAEVPPVAEEKTSNVEGKTSVSV